MNRKTKVVLGMDKKTEDVNKEKDIKAATTAVRNSYYRMLSGEKQLAYVFFAGMQYGRTGELPKDLLNDIVENGNSNETRR